MSRFQDLISCLGVFAILSLTAVADEVDDLIGQLQDSDAFVRCYAAEQLGTLKDKRAVDPLLELLEHPRPLKTADLPAGKEAAPDSPAATVDKAKRAVAGGDQYSRPGLSLAPEVLKQHLAALRGRSMMDQKKALEALGQARDKRAVSALIKMLQDSRTGEILKPDIIEALGAIGDPSAYDLIVSSLKEGHGRSTQAAATALGKLGDPRAAKVLYETMLEGISVRDEAAEALRQLGGYEAVLYLNKAMADGDTFTRRDAQKVLDEMGPNHGLEPLLALLKDPDPQVRGLAAQSLAALNDPVVDVDLQQATGTLSEQDRRAVETAAGENKPSMLNSSLTNEVNVKIAAIHALGCFRDVKMIKPLMGQLIDPSNAPDVRRAAGKTLAQYQNAALLRTFEAELNSRDKDRQVAALESLGYMGTDEAIKMMEPGLNDAFLKDDVIKAMALSDNPKVLPHLYKALESPFLRKEALGAIIRMNNPDSAVAVAKVLSTEMMGVRERVEILDYLASSGNPKIIPYLKEQAADPFVGEQVVDMLVKQNRPEIVEPLVSALVNGSDSKARHKAMNKLVEMKAPQTLDLIVQAILDLGQSDDNPIIKAGSNVRMSVRLGLNDELPAALEQLADKEHVDDMAKLLPIAELQDGVAGILKKYNWQPTTTEQKINFYIATQNWQACKEIGRPVIPYLLEKLKVSRSGPLASVLAQMNCAEAKPILLEKLSGWSISPEQLKVLQDEFGWRPATVDDKLAVAASTSDKKAILNLWKQDPSVQQLIVKELNDSSDTSVETVMRFCIRLGKDGLVSAMISRFQRIKDDSDAVCVANLFLNSGHAQLDQAARSWADTKGYTVVDTFMGAGGAWGEG